MDDAAATATAATAATAAPQVGATKKRKRRKLPKSLSGGNDSTDKNCASAVAVPDQISKPKKRKRRKMPKSLSGIDSNKSQDASITKVASTLNSTMENSNLATSRIAKCEVPIQYVCTAKAVEELMAKLLEEVGMKNHSVVDIVSKMIFVGAVTTHIIIFNLLKL